MRQFMLTEIIDPARLVSTPALGRKCQIILARSAEFQSLRQTSKATAASWAADEVGTLKGLTERVEGLMFWVAILS